MKLNELFLKFLLIIIISIDKMSAATEPAELKLSALTCVSPSNAIDPSEGQEFFI